MALKELWTKDEAEFPRQVLRFPLRSTAIRNLPQKPHPPILLGGNAPNVLRRIARWGDGWLPNRAEPRRIKEGRAILDTLAAERDRDPASITISIFGQPPDTTREQVESFLNVGAARVSLWLTHCDTEAEMGEQLERMADALIR